MRENYGGSLAAVLHWEGGKVDHPKDPGGRTNQGVTQKVYDAFRGNKGLPRRDVFVMTANERDEIYREQYWNVVKGDQLPKGVDYVVFDYAVNSGCVRAVKALQTALGVKADGVIGNVTLARVNGINDRRALVQAICRQRLSFLQNLTQLWKVFGKGWRNRVVSVEKTALTML